MLIVAGNNIL